MARARKVEAETALDAAVSAFWRRGYQGLSTRQMETDTGITRFTLQTVYGGKKPLFLRALDRYLDNFEAKMVPSMSDGTLEGLARWFEIRCDAGCTPDEGKWGCLMINSIAEFGSEDADVNARTLRFYGLLSNGFRDALARIKAQQDMPDGFSIEAQSEVLKAASIGMNVMIRSAQDCTAGVPVAAGVAAMVRGWAS